MGFRRLDHVQHRQLLRRPRERETPVEPALRVDQATPAEALHHLGQVARWHPRHLGDLLGCLRQARACDAR